MGGDIDGEEDRSGGVTGGGEIPIPWLYERDSVTDGRTTRQIYLQDETLARERELRSAVQPRLGVDIKKADLREAALLVAMNHPDEVADQLREWGYDF